jgi:hypothetical protein
VSWLEVRATLPPDSDTSPFIEIFRDHGIESTQEINGSLVGCLADVEGSAARIEVLKCALQSTGVGNVEVEAVLPSTADRTTDRGAAILGAVRGSGG